MQANLGDAMMRLSGLLMLTLAVIAPVGPSCADEAAMALGKKVFLEISSPQCALCHTLADAGASGAVGPVLDELKPTTDRVRTAVTKGIGPMPPNSSLTPEQVEAVALYVSRVAGGK